MNKSARVSAISHVAIAASDMERSLAFYRDTLGLRQHGDVFTVDDKASAALWGLSRMRGRHRVALLHCGEALVTVVCFDEADTTQRAAPSENVGLSHFGFWVADVDGFYDEMSGKGVEFTSPPYTTGPVPIYGAPMRVTRFLDPDGVAIEVYGLVGPKPGREEIPD